VISLIALFVALGGTSYAAISLPRNSVGTKQLKNSAVTSTKIMNGAVTGAKVNVATLGKVPSAANADHAASADNALALGGQPAANYELGPGQTTVKPFDTGPETVLTFNTPGGTISLYCAVPAAGGDTMDANYRNTGANPANLMLEDTTGNYAATIQPGAVSPNTLDGFQHDIYYLDEVVNGTEYHSIVEIWAMPVYGYCNGVAILQQLQR
jgi:hypothetical protein